MTYALDTNIIIHLLNHTPTVLSRRDEQKSDFLFALLGDLDYVDAQEETIEKIWIGNLPVFKNPVSIPSFRMFSREELHEP